MRYKVRFTVGADDTTMPRSKSKATGEDIIASAAAARVEE
jgi:hypothetical protein